MKKFLKGLLCVLAIVLVIVIVKGIAFFNTLGGLLGGMSGQEKITDCFKEKREAFFAAAEYMMLQEGEETNIDREEVSGEELERLFEEEKVLAVQKETDRVYIVMGTAKDFEQGMVFSKDDSIPYVKNGDRVLFYKTEPKWYYYEIVD